MPARYACTSRPAARDRRTSSTSYSISSTMTHAAAANTPPITTASSTYAATSRRRREVSGRIRINEPVPYAGNGYQHLAGEGFVYRLANGMYVGSQCTALGWFVTPELAFQRFTGNNRWARPQQDGENAIPHTRQLDPSPLSGDFMRRGVEAQRAYAQHRSTHPPTFASYQGGQPRFKLCKRKRLYQVVIGA